MFNKFLLLRQVLQMLKKKDFEVFVNDGCFDIAARREYLLLLKVLFNIDCLSEEKALSLRTIAYFLSAYPFIIASRSAKYKLQHSILYERFGIPVATPKLLERLVDEQCCVAEASKGRFTVEIDTELLRRKRMEKNYTLAGLARLVGISKKALYEIEHHHVKPKIKHVEKLEEILKIKLRKDFSFEDPDPAYLKPKDGFVKSVANAFSKMKIEHSPVYDRHFNIVGKEKKVFVASLQESFDNVLKNIDYFRDMEQALLVKPFFVVRTYTKEHFDGLPVIAEDRLKETTREEFKKLINSTFL